jgi:hypothetical protein
VNDAETFTRLYYFGKVQMGLGDDEFWLMPFGFFLDLWACHKQFLGLEKAHRELSVDDIVPV